MGIAPTASGSVIAAPEPRSGVCAALLDVRGVAALLGCSPRHVYRLADAGNMPAPVRLGTLVRWQRQALEAWLAAGCPAAEKGGRP